MKIERQGLESLIRNKIFHASKSYIKEKIEKELTTSGKYSLIQYKNIEGGITPLSDLKEAELYWFIESASKYLDTVCAPDKYFEESEIQNAKFYVNEATPRIEFPIVFENVENLVPYSGKQFGFFLSVKQLSLLKSSGFLEVIPELQRDSKKDKYGELKTKVNKTRARNIKNTIESGGYFYDQIKINLMNDESANFEYDPEKRTLTIFSGTMIIPDGNHRTIGCELTNLSNTNSENKYSIAFTFLTPMETKELLAQTWNMEPISNRQKQSMKITNSNMVLDAILRNPDADPIYVKSVVRGEQGTHLQNGFILYDVLSKAIDKYYNTDTIETQDERREVVQWLIQFLNRLTSILVADFKNYQVVSKNRWSVDGYAFVGYIMLSKHLQGQDDWREKLKSIIDSIDFSKENSPLVKRTAKNNFKTTENFFEEVISHARNV